MTSKEDVKDTEGKGNVHNYVLTTEFEVCLNTESINHQYVYYPYRVQLEFQFFTLEFYTQTEKHTEKANKSSNSLHVNHEIKHNHVENK